MRCAYGRQAREMAQPQDDAQASTAPKLAMEEGMLDFREPALTLHNKAHTPVARQCRGLCGCRKQLAFK